MFLKIVFFSDIHLNVSFVYDASAQKYDIENKINFDSQIKIKAITYYLGNI